MRFIRGLNSKLMAFPAQFLLPILIPAERLINSALSVDALSQSRLGELNGKVIAIHETTLNATVAISVVSNSVQLLNDFDGQADVSLSGDYASLIELVKSSDALYGSSIRIEGELGVAETLRSIVGQLDIDIETLLSPIAGGTVARQAGLVFESASAWFKRTNDGVRLNIKDYLQEEINVLVPPALFSEFSDEVTRIREAVDRADARLRRLEHKHSAKSPDNSLGKSSDTSSGKSS